MSVVSGPINSTGTNGASTTRALNGSGNINSLQLIATVETGGTPVTFSIYDNNVATSATLGTGATWTGKSPGYSGVGPTPAGAPGTVAFKPEKYQSARTGDQAGETAPNVGAADYWQITAAGNVDYTLAPVVAASIVAPTADGDGSYPYLDQTNPVGNVVAAVTAAPLLYQVTLAAGQSATWSPGGASVLYGIDIVTSGVGVTALTGSFNLDYNPLP